MKPLTLILCSCALSSFGSAQAIDTVNGQYAAYAGQDWGGTDTVGFTYVPTQTYDLGKIESKFSGDTAGRSVTASIFTADPADGGTLLGAGSFSPQSGWSGGSFPAVHVTQGASYFVGFTGVSGMFNCAGEANADHLPFRFGASGGTPFAYYGSPVALIARFDAVPEPMTMAALGLGLVTLACRKRRA